MRLGLVSDTHGWLHPELPRALDGCDLILHAGDIGTPEVLEPLQAVAPVRAVWGNIDGQDLRRAWPEDDRFEVEGVRFWLRHIVGHPGRWAPGMGARLRADPPDVLVCGHSHILRVERVPSLGRMLFVNPGAAGRHGFHQVKTCVLLTVADGAARQADVVHLDG